MDPYAQSNAQARFRWGRRGARAASLAGDVVVVVDVLSFSTTVSLAVSRGAAVYPSPQGPEAAELAASVGATLATRRGEGGLSLSPASVAEIEAGTRIVLPSPNGSFCSHVIGERCDLLVGCLLNASAAARVALTASQASGRAITVLACGERWRGAPDPDDGSLRVALEDALGAGAVLAALPVQRSAEAELCTLAFQGARERLGELLADCASGRELIEGGYAADVEAAARLDTLRHVPRWRDGRFEGVEA
jgi:2-phosphosulfolactate phosphatase